MSKENKRIHIQHILIFMSNLRKIRVGRVRKTKN